METKKKALALINKFQNEVGMFNDEAIKSALITVNEILDLGYVYGEKSSYNVYSFYSKVKIELLKIQRDGIRA